MLDFRLDSEFNIIFCSGALHYLPPELRREILENYQNHTSAGGLHALNVFVRKPFLKSPSDGKECRYKWISGELFSYYADWLIASCSEDIFDCMSGGIPISTAWIPFMHADKQEKMQNEKNSFG